MSFAELEQVCWRACVCVQVCWAECVSTREGWTIRLGVQSELVVMVSGQWLPSCHVRLGTWSECWIWTPDRSEIVFRCRLWRVCTIRWASSTSILGTETNLHASWGSGRWVSHTHTMYTRKLSPRPNMSTLKCVKVTKTFYKCQRYTQAVCVYVFSLLCTRLITFQPAIPITTGNIWNMLTKIYHELTSFGHFFHM